MSDKRATKLAGGIPTKNSSGHTNKKKADRDVLSETAIPVFNAILQLLAITRLLEVSQDGNMDEFYYLYRLSFRFLIPLSYPPSMPSLSLTTITFTLYCDISLSGSRRLVDKFLEGIHFGLPIAAELYR
jgi:hypothetical protein